MSVPESEEARVAGEFADVPGPPAFFLSYARPNQHRRRAVHPMDDADLVGRFFTDLSDHLYDLLPVPAGQEIGFIDHYVPPGALWRKELMKVVGTCQSFVALLSSPYLRRSKWCAMEWDLFSRRTVIGRNAEGTNGGSAARGAIPHRPAADGSYNADDDELHTAIFPVLWAPIPHEIPPRVAKVQRFAPMDLPAEHLRRYRQEGIRGLLQVDPGAYRGVVWKLAVEIQRFVTSHEVKVVEASAFNDLRESFDEEAG